MKQKLLFVCNNLLYGGIPRSLISLLHILQDDYDIDLMLFWHGGEYLDDIPEGVHLLSTKGLLYLLGEPQRELNRNTPMMAPVRAALTGASRLMGSRLPRRLTYRTAPKLYGYDLAVSFAQDNGEKYYAIGCNDFVLDRVVAGRKAAFVHCDFTRWGGNDEAARSAYRRFDRIACVSESARESFLSVLPELAGRTVVVENAVDPELIRKLAGQGTEEGSDAVEIRKEPDEDADVRAETESGTADQTEAEAETGAGAESGTADQTDEEAETGTEDESGTAGRTEAEAETGTEAGPGTEVPDGTKPFRLVSCSRITEEKGYFRALDAVRPLFAQYPGLEWTIVGDGPLTEELARKIEEEELTGRVKLPGAKANPWPWIAQADLLFLPSFHEAAPMVLKEAAALGVPALSTDTCSDAKALEEQGFGAVCANTEEGIREGLAAWMADEERQQKTRENLIGYDGGQSRTAAQFAVLAGDVGLCRKHADEKDQHTEDLKEDRKEEDSAVLSEGRESTEESPAGETPELVPEKKHTAETGKEAVAAETGEETEAEFRAEDGLTLAAEGAEPLEQPSQQHFLDILVPAYNREETIGQCLDSLLSQRLAGCRIIVVNDGSTDGTGKILAGYAEKNPAKLKVITTDNRGVAAARNRALAEASAEYITYVDSDDWLEPGALGQLASAARETEADILLFDAREETEQGSRLYTAAEVPASLERGRLSRGQYLLTRPCPWNKWIRRTLLEPQDDMPEFRFPEGEIYEDLSAIPLLALRTDNIWYVPVEAYHYRQSSGSIMRRKVWHPDSACVFLAVMRLREALGIDYPAETEHLWWLHLLLSGGLRFAAADRTDMAAKAAAMMKRYYPGWEENPFVQCYSSSALRTARLIYNRKFAALSVWRRAADTVSRMRDRAARTGGKRA